MIGRKAWPMRNQQPGFKCAPVLGFLRVTIFRTSQVAAFALFATLSGTAAHSEEAKSSQRVVVISIDGFRSDFYRNPSYPCPNLRRLASQGASARKMFSVFPSITYVNHTSLVTGVYPRQHQIFANTVFDDQTGPAKPWNVESVKIKAEPIWERAHRKGKTVAAFSWPVTVGAKIDWNIPEVFHVDGVDTSTTNELIRRYSSPGLWDGIDLLKLKQPETFADWDDWLPQVFGTIWKEHKPDLALLHVLNADWIQHRNGTTDPKTIAALGVVDQVIGRLVEQIDSKNTTVFFVGDHGFQDTWANLHPNRLFLNQGWIVTNSAGDLKSFDVFAQANGGSAVVHCKRPELRAKVLSVLKEAAPGHFEILDKAQVDRLRSWKTDGDFLCAIAAVPGLGMSSDWKKEFVMCHTGQLRQGQHGHLPQNVPTGLIVWGKGVKAGSDLGQVQLLQIAPTVARILGLDAKGMPAQPIALP